MKLKCVNRHAMCRKHSTYTFCNLLRAIWLSVSIVTNNIYSSMIQYYVPISYNTESPQTTFT